MSLIRSAFEKLCTATMAAFLCGAGPTLAKAPALPTLVEVPVSREVSGTVNGVPMRFRADPDGVSYPVFNPDAAARLRLKHSMFAPKAIIGPIRIAGRTSVARLGLQGTEKRRRVLWFQRSIAPGFDGTLGPGSFYTPQVRFILAPPQPGERRYELPMVSIGSDFATTIDLGGGPIAVAFNLDRSHSLASPAAASDLAASHGAKFRGAQGASMIAFGVSRPVRTLQLERPLQIGPRALTSVLTRFTDGGTVAAIPDEEQDTSEIVVVAGKKSKGRRTLTLGRDMLEGCSSITYDKRARRIILTCSG